jgi:hypothetical protein
MSHPASSPSIPAISLQPIAGLTFHPEIHRYRYQGRWISHSITTVVNDKTPAQMAKIMASKDQWEPRGNTVHHCLETFLSTGEPGDVGDYYEWVLPLINHPMWKTWKAVAVEHRLVDDRHSIAGSFDALLQNQKDGRLVLADLKTQSSAHSKPRDISPQLGGYMNLIDQCHPELAGTIERGIAIWAKPGACSITTFDAPACIESYLAARHAFLAAQPDF